MIDNQGKLQLDLLDQADPVVRVQLARGERGDDLEDRVREAADIQDVVPLRRLRRRARSTLRVCARRRNRRHGCAARTLRRARAGAAFCRRRLDRRLLGIQR